MGQYFRLNGLTGYFIAVALLLTILAVLTVAGIQVQKDNATTFYKVNTDTNAIKANDINNKDHYSIVGQ